MNRLDNKNKKVNDLIISQPPIKKQQRCQTAVAAVCGNDIKTINGKARKLAWQANINENTSISNLRRALGDLIEGLLFEAPINKTGETILI